MHLSTYLREVLKLGAIPLSNRIGRPLAPPTVAAFYLTKKCNSRCKMCSFWQSGANSDEELSKEEVFQVFKDLKKIGVRLLSLSAEGELFTRKDVCDLLQKAKEMGFSCTINSNGLHQPKNFIERLNEVRPYSIVFGLDTTDSDVYEKIRGIPGGFDRVLNSIRNLKAIGYDSISIGAVILQDNLDQLIALADLARKEKVAAFRVTAFSPVGFGKSWDSGDLEGYWHPEYLNKLRVAVSRLIEFKKKHGIISNSVEYLRRIPEYYESKFQYLPIPCVIGYHNIQILPNGDVPVCAFRGQKAIIGNVRETSIYDLWHSKEAAHERREIRKGNCPSCWMSCYAENSLRFNPRTMVSCNMEVFRRSLKYDF